MSRSWRSEILQGRVSRVPSERGAAAPIAITRKLCLNLSLLKRQKLELCEITTRRVYGQLYTEKGGERKKIGNEWDRSSPALADRHGTVA